MNFCILGGDSRQLSVAQHLIAKGFSVKLFGTTGNENISTENSLSSALLNADSIILPLPASRDGKTVNTPLSKEIIYLHDLTYNSPKIIFGGMLPTPFCNQLSNSNIRFYDYYTSETLTLKNAVLTAEAALAIAVNSTEFSIYHSKVLIIGYGRIGKKLCLYFKTLGAFVTATSRDRDTLSIIETDGYTAVNTDSCANISANFDIIINTAPTPILNDAFFANCKIGTFVEDLATNSGIDLKAAEKYGINAAVYPSLPGKTSPITAAKYIVDEILLNCNFY